MAPNAPQEKKTRRVTVSGSVPIDQVSRIEEAARLEKTTVSQFIANVVLARVDELLPAA
jgi:uncharacterized protein (DUF1778 family)